MRPRFFILAASIAALAYACGGADPIVVGGDGGESGDDDASAGRRDAGSKDASISGGDAGRRDGGGSDDGGTGSDSGGFDAGGVDSGGGVDGGHPHNTGILPAECGDVGDGGLLTCNSGAPTCCANQFSDIFSNTTTYSCTTNPASCAVDAGIIPIMCRDDRDCPGTKICCGELGASAYDTIGCVDATACQVSDANARRFCSPGEWDPCPGLGETCMQSGIVFGFNICE